jgi:hypothetical protein
VQAGPGVRASTAFEMVRRVRRRVLALLGHAANKWTEGRTGKAHVGVLQEHAGEGTESRHMARRGSVFLLDGAVWRRRCELRHGGEVAGACQCPLSVCAGRSVLFGEFMGKQQVAKLAECVGEVLRGGLALDLVVQYAHGLFGGALLLGGQGRGWSGRFGGGEGDDVCPVLAGSSQAGERAMRGPCCEGEGGLLTGREGDDGGEWRIWDGLVHCGRRAVWQAACTGIMPPAIAVAIRGHVSGRRIVLNGRGEWCWLRLASRGSGDHYGGRCDRIVTTVDPDACLQFAESGC